MIEINLFLISIFIVTLSFVQSQRSINMPLPSRQVHLDFHTSEFITGIGEKFDKKTIPGGVENLAYQPDQHFC